MSADKQYQVGYLYAVADTDPVIAGYDGAVNESKLWHDGSTDAIPAIGIWDVDDPDADPVLVAIYCEGKLFTA